jgi:hypothetical protein
VKPVLDSERTQRSIYISFRCNESID